MSPEAKSAFNVVTDVATWTAVLPVTIGAYIFKNAPFAVRVIVVFAVLALLTDNVLGYFGSTTFTDYVPRVYTLVEFTAISLFFMAINKRKEFKLVVSLMFIPFIAICIFDFIVGGLRQRDDLPIGVESLLFISYSVVSLYFILKDAAYPNILARPEYWIISGILLYFGGNIFVFLTSNYIARLSADSYHLLWGLRGLMCVPFYSLLAVGLWKAKAYR